MLRHQEQHLWSENSNFGQFNDYYSRRRSQEIKKPSDWVDFKAASTDLGYQNAGKQDESEPPPAHTEAPWGHISVSVEKPNKCTVWRTLNNFQSVQPVGFLSHQRVPIMFYSQNFTGGGSSSECVGWFQPSRQIAVTQSTVDTPFICPIDDCTA